MSKATATPRAKFCSIRPLSVNTAPLRIYALGRILGCVAAGEFGASLRQPISMLGSPAPEVAQARDRVHQFEQPQAAQYLGGIEQVAGEHGNHALFQLPDIARLA